MLPNIHPGPGALALPATGMAATRIAEALAKRAGRGVAESVGSSDARRALIEALARQTNALAFMAPEAQIEAAITLELSRMQERENQSLARRRVICGAKTSRKPRRPRSMPNMARSGPSRRRAT